MRPLSIALIRGRYVDDGGAERFVARALAALKGEHVDVTLFTRAWPDADEFDVRVCRPFYLGRLWRDWAFARCVCRALARGTFDLVQSHERIGCCDIYRAGDGVHREWLRQRARVCGFFGRLRLALSPYHRYIASAERALFASPRLRAVICNSYMVKDEIKHHFGVSEEKLHVVYNGVDTNLFHPSLKRHRAALRADYGIADDAPLFLFVGSGFERKGLDLTVAALAEISQARLLVVGRDKKLERFRARAAALGIGARVHFAGRQADVRPYYGAADALILPSLYDPFPNVALEAMASGLPVITSTKCGAAEIVAHGRSGFVGDAFDRDALVAAMRALASRAVAEQYGHAARAAVEPLTLERMRAGMLRVYESVRTAP